MRKTYILDTNVLLHDPESLFSFEDNSIILPLSVIEELDRTKRRGDEVGRNARDASRKLDDLRLTGRLSEGVELPGGGSVRIELNGIKNYDMLNGVDLTTVDNRILALAYHLMDSNNGPVVLVTKDLNLRIKADVLGIATEDFYSDKIDINKLYTGVQELSLSRQEMDRFYQEGCLDYSANNLHPHQFCILKSPENPSSSALARYLNNKLNKITYDGKTVYGIKGLNKEQRFALELLLDDRLKIVTLVGNAGTGKTILARSLSAKVLNEEASDAPKRITIHTRYSQNRKIGIVAIAP